MNRRVSFRRRRLCGAALPRVGSSYARELPPPAVPGGGTVALDLVAAERPTALPCFGGATLPLWTFSDEPGCRSCG